MHYFNEAQTGAGDVTLGGGLEVAVMVEVLSSATGGGRGFKGRGVGGGYMVLMLLRRLGMENFLSVGEVQ